MTNKEELNRTKLTDEVFKWCKDNRLGPLRMSFDLDSYLLAGMIPMKDMKEGFYLGRCRNNIVAYWDDKAKLFKHIKFKWYTSFIETIPHLEEKNYSYDLFIPIRKMELEEVNKEDNVLL